MLAKECRESLEAGKEKEKDSLLEILGGMQPCQPLDFNPVRSISNV